MSSTLLQAAGQKRKAVATSSAGRKRQKIQNIREIPIQSRDAAVSATGELDIASFVKVREYEINTLEKSMQNSKKALSMRAFQQVPRAMRRRTASHNAKKVPRRLRRRAEREMKDDNTPTITARRRIPSAKQRLRMENAKRLKSLNQHSKTVRQKKKLAKQNALEGNLEKHISVIRLPKIKKNNLAEPPTATSKFKKRQVHKSWLPTHLWHTKRAHMSKPSEPLWRMAIPISPTEKSYRASHRASGGRGCIAWDMSYMSMIGCQGAEASLDGMLKAIGFHGEDWSGAKYKNWKKGTRSAEGWVFERDNLKQAVAPVVIVWSPQAASAEENNNEKFDAGNVLDQNTNAPPANAVSKTIQRKPAKLSQHRLLIRVHPSAFHQFWLLLLKVAKIQRPQVVVEDLRFQIGSIEITGPGSTEALLGVLKPVVPDDSSNSAAENIWRSLAGLANPASLPKNCLLAFDICDPRLNHPPKQIDIPKDTDIANDLAELMVSWRPDDDIKSRGIFSHKCRHMAAKNLLSQKAINRRKTLAPPGQAPNPKSTDPRIPILLLASRPSAASSGSQGTWTVLLPWKCVDAVWRSLMYYPLSSGGTPRFGGLEQLRQICLEHGEAWFPGDLAATEPGQAWERTESERRFDEWMRRSASRRVAWETVDLGSGRKGEHGRGWTCDWNFLLTGLSSEPSGIVDCVRGQVTEEVNATDKTEKQQMLKTQRQRKLAQARLGESLATETTENVTKSNCLQVECISAEPKPSSSAAPLKVEPLISDGSLQFQSPLLHLPPKIAMPLFNKIEKASLPVLPALVTVSITLLTRGTPTPCARIYRIPSSTTPAGDILRKLWLATDPMASPERRANSREKSSSARIKKEILNHRGDPKRHNVYAFESLDHVNYIPADAPPEYFKAPEHLKQVQSQAAALALAAASRSDSPTPEDRAALLQSLMVPIKDVDGYDHPACPDSDDLIGFVTTGAYNLAQGRGTAIGSVWVQRVVEGWRTEMQNEGRGYPQKQKEMGRRRRLCVVRNAGESVGRLGLWEICT